MARIIIKLDDHYLEWSTVVDAPVTEGMPRVDFETDYLTYHGTSHKGALARRMARVDAHGTSDMRGTSADEVIAGNRAGPGESCLTRDEIVEFYVRRREQPTAEALREYREKREGKT